jgi:L-alanine-DL-glutamate epimerase-like enolase superfamily enzyme
VLAVDAHLSIHAPNALLQGTVRAFYTSRYRELVTEVPPISDGRIRALEGQGLGTALRPEERQRSDVTILSSAQS